MGKIQPQSEPIRHYGYILSDPVHRDIVRAFGAELEKFIGPWKWEQYCRNKGYYAEAKEDTVTVQGKTYIRVTPNRFKKDIEIKYNDDCEKKKAWESMKKFESKIAEQQIQYDI